jgi:hypothetical protein
MYVTSKIIFGSDAVRHYNETGEIPAAKTLEDLDGTVLEKDFKSKEEYDAYISGLEESDGWSDWIVADQNFESPKNYSLDDIIKNLLKEGPLVALYFWVGISLMKEVVEEMTDEDIIVMFSKLFHPDEVREKVEYIFNKMNKK